MQPVAEHEGHDGAPLRKQRRHDVDPAPEHVVALRAETGPEAHEAEDRRVHEREPQQQRLVPRHCGPNAPDTDDRERHQVRDVDEQCLA